MRLAMAVVLLVFFGGTAFAGETVLALRDVTGVQDGRGASRVLFRTAALPSFEHRLIESAILSVPYAGSVVDRAREVRVCPVTEAWQGAARWSTAFDEELYARGTLDLRRGSGTMMFDVTVALREIVEHGLTADGFVLTGVASGDGIPTEDASRLSDLSGARLTVRTIELPSGMPPPEWFARRGQ